MGEGHSLSAAHPPTLQRELEASLPLQEFDRRMLLRTLELAERGRGCTRPNPVVGSVVVREGRVLSEAHHVAVGEDHAEVAALKAAAPGQPAPTFGGRLRGTTVYVSLEPCSHFGRTPPCADLLVQAGVTRVVVAASERGGVRGVGAFSIRRSRPARHHPARRAVRRAVPCHGVETREREHTIGS